MDKVELADKVSQRVTEGDQGQVRCRLSPTRSRKPSPQRRFTPEASEVPKPYMDLARLARYEHVARHAG